MERLQEFGNEKDALIPSGYTAMKRIEKLPLPFTGNKKKLIYNMHDVLRKRNLQFDSVLDAFTGSATVSFLFKMMGKRVLANDLLTSSYMNAVAFVENPGIKLTNEEKDYLLNHHNPNKGTFVEDNYLGVQYRPKGKDCRFNKFTLQECQHLDNFRANVDSLCDRHLESLSLAANAAVVLRLPFGNVDQSHDIMKHRVKQEKHFGKDSDKCDRRIGIYYDDEYNLRFDKWFLKYVDDFMKAGDASNPKGHDVKIKRAAFFANLQQHVLRDCFVGGRMHQGQVLAEIDPRLSHQKNQLKRHFVNDGSSEMNFHSQQGEQRRPGEGLKWWTFADLKLPGSCLAVNMDVVELLQKDFCQVDCVYFDPPYGGQSSDYATMYRFLEEYVYEDKLENLPHIARHAQRFIKKKDYEDHFAEMLEAAEHIPLWLFSYNDSSWKGIDYITDLIRQYRSKVEIEILTADYRYLYRKVQGRKSKSTEYLIIAR
ncbi:MAG: DNA adenine methylase [Promethearchaeota archaeon]|jgi:adenine-specific DNA methylase